MAPCEFRSLTLLVLLFLQCSAYDLSEGTTCPGQFTVEGLGQTQLTSTSTNVPGEDAGSTGVQFANTIVAGMNARVYFSQTCINGTYNNERYSAVQLAGRTFSFTTDISDAGCGCNAALYLVSMNQNTNESKCHDYYCDANKVCGVSCTEVDIMEGNKHAWHSTLHSTHDHSGLGAGLGGGTGWNGPRDWSKWDYGPGGKCIDTHQPFNVAVSFPAEGGQLKGMTVKLSQKDKDCPLSVSLNTYDGMAEIQKALELGMTPVISYWKAKDMLWLDGKGSDGQGPCNTDSDRCGDSVKFYNFKLEAMPGQPPLPPTTSPPPSLTPSNMAGDIVAMPPIPPVFMTVEPPLATQPPVPMVQPVVPAVPFATLAPMTLPLGQCSAKGMDCRQTQCCSDAGMQCYLKDQDWAGCRLSCVPGTIDPDDTPQWRQPWSCTPLGARTPADQGQFGTLLSFFTVQRVVTMVVALLVLMGLGLLSWRSRAAANNGTNGVLMCHRRGGWAGARPPRTGLEKLQQRSPGPGQPHGTRLQHPFVGALVVPHLATRMSSWQLAPTTPKLVQSP